MKINLGHKNIKELQGNLRNYKESLNILKKLILIGILNFL